MNFVEIVLKYFVNAEPQLLEVSAAVAAAVG